MQRQLIKSGLKLLKFYFKEHTKINDFDIRFEKISETHIEDCENIIKIRERDEKEKKWGIQSVIN